MNYFNGDVIQSGVCLVTCPVLGTPKLHFINRLGIYYWKWNVIIYIQNCFRINDVIIFAHMVCRERGERTRRSPGSSACTGVVRAGDAHVVKVWWPLLRIWGADLHVVTFTSADRRSLLLAQLSHACATFVGVSRGNTIRGNRTERFWEGNLPLRGSLRGSLRGRVSEVFRGFSEGLRGL